ncbi:hypothetical protein Tco_1393513 [Tanacetum coccineum]
MCALYSRRDTFTPLNKIPKEILAMESVSFPPPPTLVGSLEKQTMSKFWDYHRDRGRNTNDCYHLKRQIEDAVAIRRASLTGSLELLDGRPIILEGTIEGYHVLRIYVDGGSSSEIMYEHCFKNFDASIWSRIRKCNTPLVGFSGEGYHPLGLIDLRVTIREPGRSKIVLLKFAIVKCRSPYNVVMGRTGMRSLRTVGSTIHSMIKFPAYF